MKKVIVLLGFFAFVGFLVTPTVMAYTSVVKVAVQDDPPKTDKKDGKCATPCATDKKCDPSKCASSKDAKSGKSCCSSKAKSGCDKSKKADEGKAEEKTPVPNK